MSGIVRLIQAIWPGRLPRSALSRKKKAAYRQAGPAAIGVLALALGVAWGSPSRQGRTWVGASPVATRASGGSRLSVVSAGGVVSGSPEGSGSSAAVGESVVRAQRRSPRGWRSLDELVAARGLLTRDSGSTLAGQRESVLRLLCGGWSDSTRYQGD